MHFCRRGKREAQLRPRPARPPRDDRLRTRRGPTATPRWSAHAQVPPRGPGSLTCSELSREPPGFPMHFRKHLSVILCGDTRAQPRHPPPVDPTALSARPGPPPDLQQLLRVSHGDLHLHLLHDEPRVQLAAAGAPEIRAEATLHGSAKSTEPRPRAPTRTHAGSRPPRAPREMESGRAGNGAGSDYSSHKAVHPLARKRGQRPASAPAASGSDRAPTGGRYRGRREVVPNSPCASPRACVRDRRRVT